MFGEGGDFFARSPLPLQGLKTRFSPCQHWHADEHIFGEDPVSHGGVTDHHVCDGSHELAVLNNRRARHECGQEGTTVFYKIFIKLAHRLGGGALFLSVLINL